MRRYMVRLETGLHRERGVRMRVSDDLEVRKPGLQRDGDEVGSMAISRRLQIPREHVLNRAPHGDAVG